MGSYALPLPVLFPVFAGRAVVVGRRCGRPGRGVGRVELVAALTKNPAVPTAAELTKLLKAMPGRLDVDTVKLLADYVIKGGPHQSAVVGLLLDALANLARKDTPNKALIAELVIHTLATSAQGK